MKHFECHECTTHCKLQIEEEAVEPPYLCPFMWTDEPLKHEKMEDIKTNWKRAKED